MQYRNSITSLVRIFHWVTGAPGVGAEAVVFLGEGGTLVERAGKDGVAEAGIVVLAVDALHRLPLKPEVETVVAAEAAIARTRHPICRVVGSLYHTIIKIFTFHSVGSVY